MKEKCYFLRQDDSCLALSVELCTDPEGCKFYKTEQQYMKDFDDAVRTCRKKQLCHRCVYKRGNPCKLSTEIRGANRFGGVR